MILNLYEGLAGRRVRYFLDKTPRYGLVVDEIVRLFPDGRLIFLWRNPLAALASRLRTWGHGRWCPENWYVDLFDMLTVLVRSYQKYGGRAVSLRFEDLV